MKPEYLIALMFIFVAAWAILGTIIITLMLFRII